MATKPTKLPLWDTNATNSVEPPTVYQQDGYPAGKRIPASWFNQQMNLIGQWLDALTSTAVADWKVTAKYPAVVVDNYPMFLQNPDGTVLSSINNAGADLAKVGINELRSDVIGTNTTLSTTTLALGGDDATGYRLLATDDDALAVLATPITSATTGTADVLYASGLDDFAPSVIDWISSASKWLVGGYGTFSAADRLKTFTNATADAAAGTWTEADSVAVDERFTGLAYNDNVVLMSKNDGNAYISAVPALTVFGQTATSGLDALYGAVWREADSKFYCLGIRTSDTLPVLVTFDEDGLNPAIIEVGSTKFGTISTPAGHPGAIAIDPDGGMCFTMSFDEQSFGSPVGGLWAYYYPVGAVPGTDEPQATQVATDTGDWTTNGDRRWAYGHRRLIYNTVTGQYVTSVIERQTQNLAFLATTRPLVSGI